MFYKCFITKGTSQSYVSKIHIDTQDNQQQQSLLIDTQYNVRKNILFYPQEILEGV